jgi:hypothetical protein
VDLVLDPVEADLDPVDPARSHREGACRARVLGQEVNRPEDLLDALLVGCGELLRRCQGRGLPDDAVTHEASPNTRRRASS